MKVSPEQNFFLHITSAPFSPTLLPAPWQAAPYLPALIAETGKIYAPDIMLTFHLPGHINKGN
jgi:hypothetical protein